MSPANTLPYSFLPVDILKSDIIRGLNRSHLVVLIRIISLCGWQARKGKTGKPYAVPGQKWLGEVCGMRRETVSRAVHRLQSLGLLTITRRRRVHGIWQTNLYKVGPALWRALNRPKEAIRAALSHVTSKSHPVTVYVSKQKNKEREGGLHDVREHVARLKSIFDGG